MKYFIWFLSVLLSFGTACTEDNFDEYSKKAKEAKALVVVELFAQQECWNKGDIDCFMTGYWNNDSLMFVSGENVSYGWKQVTENYKIKYSSKELMGELKFTVDKVQALSANSIILIGAWDLKSESADSGGKFTLLWRKINGEWKIVIDHTS
ncbi:MAG: ketosteroid isomerase-like protein [Salibacteraceae bacterium]|jgi:ketosteroid isomerase-like protein